MRGGRIRLAIVALAAAAGLACDLLPSRPPGERLYRQLCAGCHGLDGAGNTPRSMGNPYADLTDDVWRHGGDRYAIEQVIRDGVFGQMPGQPQLDREQMRQLVGYVLELRGESG